MKIKKNRLWGELALGVCCTISGILTGLYGGWYRDAPVPSEGGWIMAGAGFLVVLLSIRGMIRGDGKIQDYTDKDVEEAKRRLEQMHIKEHGVPPDYSDSDCKK